MPYLLMAKAYEYDDQYYYQSEGGYPELFFDNTQQLKAVEHLEVYQRNDFVRCTPLKLRYHSETLADLSSSGLDEDALVKGISAVLSQTLTAEEILELDFDYKQSLSYEQQLLLSLMLDEVNQSYLEFVNCYGAG